MKSSLHTVVALYTAFRYFNRQLFERRLPKASIGIDAHRRNFHSLYHPIKTASRYRTDEDVDNFQFGASHQIVLSTHLFLQKPLKEALSYLVREMASVWQHEFGSPSRRGYFNRQWSEKMESIGLIPSQTGKPGGKKTGQGIGHYVETGGKYELAYHLMYDNKKASLLQMNLPLPSSKKIENAPGKSRNKRKYSCPSCRVNVWGKPGLYIICGECNIQLIQISGLAT